MKQNSLRFSFLATLSVWAGEKCYSSILSQCVYVLQLVGAETHFMAMKTFSHVHISESLTPGMAIKPQQPQK